jgi:hypothetical protein
VDPIQELLQEAEDASDLTDERVGELEAELLRHFDAIRAGESEHYAADDVEVLRAIAQAVENLRALAAVRIAEAQQRNDEIAELARSVHGDDDAEPESSDGEEAENVSEPDEEPVQAAGQQPENADESDEKTEEQEQEQPEAVVAAATPSISEIVARSGMIRTRPRRTKPADSHRPSNLHLSTDTGRPVSTIREGYEHMASRFHELGSNAGKRVLLSVVGDYPEHRRLGLDPRLSADRFDAVVAAANNPDAWTDAVVASGGWCAPSAVDYSLVLEAQASRPVRDALPDFGADRGGVRLPVSPTLSSIDTTGADAAVGQHTNTEDINEATKPVQVIDCPEFAEFRAYAVTKRLRFGNLGQRAFPENVAQWSGLAQAAHARLAETLLLDAIKNDAGTTQVTDGQTFGAARDILESVIRAAAARRSSERTGDVRLRWLGPAWIIDLMQADLIRSGEGRTDLVTARSEIIQMLSDAGVTPTFYVDSPSTGTSQLLPRQTNGGTLAAWPCQIQWALFAEGHFGFLDGGTLDLGVIRDSTLNSTNDFETFAETFEGIVARRGPEALWVTQNVVADGSYAAGVDGAVSCGS